MSGSDDTRGGNRRGAEAGRGGPAGKKGSAGRGFGGPRRDRDGGGRPKNDRGRPDRGGDKFTGKDRSDRHGEGHRQRQFGQARGEEYWSKQGGGDKRGGGPRGGGDRSGFRRDSKFDDRRGGNRGRDDRRGGPRDDRKGNGQRWGDRKKAQGERRSDDRPRKFDRDGSRSDFRDERKGKPRFDDRKPRSDRERPDRNRQGGRPRDDRRDNDRRDNGRRWDDRSGKRGGDRPAGPKEPRGKTGRFEHEKPRRFEQERPASDEVNEQTQAEETAKAQSDEPELPEDIDVSELHGEIRREMRSLPKGLADKVAIHLVAAGKLMDTDPEKALEHARFARRRASRIGAVREANGLTAYQMGEWNEALSELRAARRMFGGPGHVAIMADCERALGRPERALELSRSPEAAELTGHEAVELRIVAAGARRDLGEVDASVVSLQIPELDPQRQEPWSARLFYAYADNLLAADRVQEAFTWFVHAAHADDEGETDAPERLDELVAVLGGADAAEELVAEAEAVGPLNVIEADDPADSGGDGSQ